MAIYSLKVRPRSRGLSAAAKAYANARHIAQVEIDRARGRARALRYWEEALREHDRDKLRAAMARRWHAGLVRERCPSSDWVLHWLRATNHVWPR